jgi:1-acyl-sn-glycerol-3-phosphate acyltransferase
MDLASYGRSEKFLHSVTPTAWAFFRLAFRYRMLGFERLPPAPCLLVGNHSGTGLVEPLCMAAAWYRHFGRSRPAMGITSNVIDSLLGPITRRMGAIRGSQTIAQELLEGDTDVLVFPGGEIDSFRPVWEHRRVRFGDRRGYLRLAIHAGVPIVPLATIGSHFTVPLGPGHLALARAIRLKKWIRAEAVPVPLLPLIAVPAAATALAHHAPPIVAAAMVLASLLPLPARITSEIQEPIVDHLNRDADDPSVIEDLNALVHGKLEAAVRRLSHP